MRLVALLLAALAALAAAAAQRVPLIRGQDVIEGSYIVVFRPETSFSVVTALASENKARHTLKIADSFKAFSAELSNQALELLRDRTDVIKYIEADKIIRVAATQLNATWGLDRIDQRNLPLDTKYNYYDSAGEGVDVYVIDTGVLNTHVDFGGRAVSGYDFHNDDPDATDDNGHGTHVASTCAGTTWGVAKKAKIIGVKTLGRFGAGSLTNVARGVEWAAAQHSSAPGKKSVANMSLGGPATPVLDDAVAAAIEAGLIVVAAAGNSNVDACETSPVRVPTVIAVAASNSSDIRASFSNYGACTNLFAPGQDITGAWIGGNDVLRTISGTSMACPHVCGAVAVLLGQEGAMTPAEAKKTLLDRATPNLIGDTMGTPNLLLFSAF